MKHLSLSLLSLAALTTAARAEVIVHKTEHATTHAQAVMPVEVQRFDASLGTLHEVRIDVQLRATGGIGYENLSPAFARVTTTFGAACVLRAEGGATLATTAAEIEATRIFKPFDGRVDFAGTSGTVDLGLEVNAEGGFLGAGDPYWVTGILPQPPTMTLALELIDLTRVSAPGQYVVRRGQINTVEVVVTFAYTPFPD